MKLCMAIVCCLLFRVILHLEWGPRDNHTHTTQLATAAHNASTFGTMWSDPTPHGGGTTARSFTNTAGISWA